MPRPAIADEVSNALELLSRPGALLHTASARSTMNLFSPQQRAVRAARIGREYMDLQPDVRADGLAAVVTAGPPGAGKTTALEHAGFDETYRNIDPDLVKDFLVGTALEDDTFADLLSISLPDGKPIMPMELASLIHRESVSVAENIAAVAMRAGENVILQGSLAWDGQPAQLLEQLEEFEYAALTIIDVEVDEDVAQERAIERWWLGRNDPHNALGGRYVPRYLIHDLYQSEGRTKCRTNAEVMLGMSKIPNTTLRTTSRGPDMTTESVSRKEAGPAGLDPPLNFDLG